MRSNKVVIAGVIVLFAVGLVVAGFGAIAQNRPERSAANHGASAAADGGLERLSAPAKPAAETTSRASTAAAGFEGAALRKDRKSTRLNSSHLVISYAVFCLKKKKK